MNDVAIQVRSLGKLYHIGHNSGHKTFRESITSAFYAPLRRLRKPLNPNGEENFWALRDVSFDIKRGEVVGVIGRNGAGKSTLLKILSRITEPTEGEAIINGRVGSLLEVGTGFHPELTGRENIYLNGAILGMKRGEIDRKYDEIIAFSEIEKFLDTPVKHYSSGMYMRLAFAVAAHLDPEILIVDEVLAVGDAQFQKKCMGKMDDVARAGRTVLFVSHNMAAISSLCNRVIALKSGGVWATGGIEIIAAYLNSFDNTRHHTLKQRPIDEIASKRVWFTSIRWIDALGKDISVGITGQELSLCFEYEAKEFSTFPDFAFTVYNDQGHAVGYFDSEYSGNLGGGTNLEKQGAVVCRIPKLPLVPGSYTINALIHCNNQYEDHVVGATTLNVEGGDYYGTGKLPPKNYAPIIIDHQWVVR